MRGETVITFAHEDKTNVILKVLPKLRVASNLQIDSKLKNDVIQDVALLKLVGFKPIIVHGGGKEINRWLDKVGKEPQFIKNSEVRRVLRVMEECFNSAESGNAIKVEI